MKRAIAVVLVGLFAAAAFAADEQWLEYRTGTANSVAGVVLKAAPLKVEAAAPAGLKIPEGASALRFAKWETPMAKAGAVWFAFAAAAKGPAGTLYVDSNCDGSLADEKPVSATTTRANRSQFTGVKIVFPLDGGETTSYHLNVTYYDYPELKQAAVMSGGWYEGDVSVPGAEGATHVVLVDSNSNGTFNDVSTDPARCDRISVKSGDNFITTCLGRYLQISNKLYEVEAARDGAFVRLKPAGDVPMGTVKVLAGITKIRFIGAAGNLEYEVKDGAVSVPAGKWLLNAWTLSRTDPSGMTWTVVASDPSRSPEIEVAAGKVATVDAGEPVIATVSVSRSGDSYTFMEILKGKYGENLKVQRADNAQLPAPSLRIKNADGSYNTLQSFQYG